MKYYKVKPEYDNRTRYTWNNLRQRVSNGILIANELYTLKEFEKLAICSEWFEVVEINKRSMYWLFGARFENKAMY